MINKCLQCGAELDLEEKYEDEFFCSVKCFFKYDGKILLEDKEDDNDQ